MMVEVVGARFNRPTNVRYLILRFPRIVKVYYNYSLDDTIDFIEY